VLEELGHQVTTAATPHEAMDLLTSQRFDLTITDFRMPEMTGAELIRWMRDQGIVSPVIMISGFVDALGLTEENTGADVVIQKSAHEVNHMVRAVRSLLKRPLKKPAGTDRPPNQRSKKASSS
jgi:CheY-like chemotaxis protein